MTIVIGLIFALSLVGVTGYLCYNWGYQDGVKAGEWESVLARSARINAADDGSLNL